MYFEILTLQRWRGGNFLVILRYVYSWSNMVNILLYEDLYLWFMLYL